MKQKSSSSTTNLQKIKHLNQKVFWVLFGFDGRSIHKLTVCLWIDWNDWKWRPIWIKKKKLTFRSLQANLMCWSVLRGCKQPPQLWVDSFCYGFYIHYLLTLNKEQIRQVWVKIYSTQLIIFTVCEHVALSTHTQGTLSIFLFINLTTIKLNINDDTGTLRIIILPRGFVMKSLTSFVSITSINFLKLCLLN